MGDAHDETVRERLVKLFDEHLRNDDVQTLTAYQEMFPGNEITVAEVYREMITGEAEPTSTGVDSATLEEEIRNDLAFGIEPKLDTYVRRFPGDLETFARHFIIAKDEANGELDAPESLPATFGNYELLEVLGRGAQGTVYRARDAKIDRIVAVKLLALNSTTPLSRETLRRFHRETALAARIDDPGVCAVYDTGVLGRVPFIAMQYIEGRTLFQTMQQPDGEKSPDLGSDETRRTLAIVERLARSLHCAHEAGVVHRDIKPSNIILRENDTPVLLDFGFAARLDGDATITKSGDLFGTPPYMSPEQITRGGITTDRRTDIWSLGVILYEWTSGRHPFGYDPRSSRESVFHAIMHEPPRDLRAFTRAFGADLKIVVEKTLEKNRDRRYPTALELANEIRRVREHEPIHARPPGVLLKTKRWCRRNRGVAAALSALFLVMAIAIGVFGWMYRDADQAAEMEREQNRRIQELDRQKTRILQMAFVDNLEVIESATWPTTLSVMGNDDTRLIEASARELVSEIPRYEAEAKSLDQRLFDEPAGGSAEDRVQRARLAKFLGCAADVERFLDDLAQRRRIASWYAQLADRTHLQWGAAIRTITDEGTCPKYGGLELKPQAGLIPLGRNDDSELYEFLHWPSCDLAGDTMPDNPEGGIVFVLLPGGRVTIGSPEDEPDRNSLRESQITVELAPFFMAKYEVTQAQWKRIMRNNPSVSYPGAHATIEVTWNHPVERVTWGESREFARRLDLTLPTEFQWEYAARGGETCAFAFGDNSGYLEGAENVYDQSLAAEDFVATPTGQVAFWNDLFPLHAPVGSFDPNAFGLYDTHGNVSEWCADAWGLSRHDKPGRLGDGLYDATDAVDRVHRGGSWYVGPRLCRSAHRWKKVAGTSAANLGVRLARPVAR